nr:uncharacterized protein LOC128685940 [Cherax quadricarinatus]
MSMASSTARMVAPNQGRGRRLAPKFSMTPSVSMAPLMTPTVAAPEAKAPSSEACLLPSAPLTDQWDNQSSRLLINLLKEYPKAYFIKSRKEKRADAWEMIRTRLIEAGFQFTVLQRYSNSQACPGASKRQRKEVTMDKDLKP